MVTRAVVLAAYLEVLRQIVADPATATTCSAQLTTAALLAAASAEKCAATVDRTLAGVLLNEMKHPHSPPWQMPRSSCVRSDVA
eukprot:1012-Heterococcus_DN1.PRE.2